MTYMSFIVHCLSLLKIIPGGKSTVLDRISLFIWTAVSVALSAVYLIISWDVIEVLCNQLSVSNLFILCSSFLLPILNLGATLPALYYLASAYPHILTDNLLPSLQNPWLFLANTVLCAAALASYLVMAIPDDKSFYFIPVNVTIIIYWYSLMIISSLIIGICTAQIETKIRKNTLLTQHHASKILQEFQDLKVGISPLLFMAFSSKCIVLINLLSLLLSTFPHTELVILAAYLMMDLFYITTELDQTYNAFKAMTLKLRYSFQNLYKLPSMNL